MVADMNFNVRVKLLTAIKRSGAKRCNAELKISVISNAYGMMGQAPARGQKLSEVSG
jgi:hypothetical protein